MVLGLGLLVVLLLRVKLVSGVGIKQIDSSNFMSGLPSSALIDD